jgi:hypothetical protein
LLQKVREEILDIEKMQPEMIIRMKLQRSVSQGDDQQGKVVNGEYSNNSAAIKNPEISLPIPRAI